MFYNFFSVFVAIQSTSVPPILTPCDTSELPSVGINKKGLNHMFVVFSWPTMCSIEGFLHTKEMPLEGVVIPVHFDLFIDYQVSDSHA